MNADALRRFALMDTGAQVSILRSTSTLETEAGDAVLGYLAGNYPDRYSAVMEMLKREEM